MAVLACQQDAGWGRAGAGAVAVATGKVRTATSDAPETIPAAVETAMVGPAADDGAEARTREADWR
jgi:hypothetical protein